MSRSICLGGREYALRYTVNAVCCLEEKNEKGLESLLRTQFSCLRALLWCGLMSGQPGMTMEDAGQLLQAHLDAGGSLSGVAAAIADALEDAGFFHQPGPEKDGKPSR